MSTRGLVLLFMLGLSSANAAKVQANPIRKIVTLMQDMQKEIEAEGEKEKVLYDNFMCFCETGSGDLAKTAEGAKAKIDETSATLETDTAEKATLDQELVEHKADREGATKDQAEAQAIRSKENEEYAATAAESKANIGSLSGAIPALEKGMGAASLMQMPGSSRLTKIVQNAQNVDSYDRDSVVAFLQDKEGGASSDQIIGIMKQMLETMQADSAEADSDEAKAAAAFADLSASKTKEIQVATSAIETKTVRSGELAVSTVQAQNALDDSEAELADAEKFAATLKVQCAEKTKEWQARSALRAQEVAAISEAIAILNDDDALDVFKKAVPAAAAFSQVGFLQARNTKASKLAKAHAMIAGAAQTYRSQPLSLLSYSMSVQLKLKSKAQNFNMIMGMIDNMVKILGDEQGEDDTHKTYCDAEFEKSADDDAAAKDKLAGEEAAVTELSDGIATISTDVATLTEQIKELDKSVATATDGRKAEHAQYTESATLNEAAAQLLEKAKQRLYKFYNPNLYKPPPKKELSMEDSLYVKGGREEFVGGAAFVQIRSHSRQMPQAPETFSGLQAPKSEKSGGVVALMEMMQKDLASDMADAKADEEMGQKEYEELMTDSAASRAQASKSITDKEASKAQLETKLQETKEAKALSTESLEDISLTVSHLHTSCDFIQQNYDARKEARTNEAESLKNSKSVLAGADLGF
jgi:hypothetical protein